MTGAIEGVKSTVIDGVGSALAGVAKGKGIPVEADSLLIRTPLSAALHYGPQDLAVVSAAVIATDRANRKLAKRSTVKDPNQALSSYLSAKGLTKEDVVVQKRGSRMLVTLRN